MVTLSRQEADDLKAMTFPDGHRLQAVLLSNGSFAIPARLLENEAFDHGIAHEDKPRRRPRRTWAHEHLLDNVENDLRQRARASGQIDEDDDEDDADEGVAGGAE